MATLHLFSVMTSAGNVFTAESAYFAIQLKGNFTHAEPYFLYSVFVSTWRSKTKGAPAFRPLSLLLVCIMHPCCTLAETPLADGSGAIRLIGEL